MDNNKGEFLLPLFFIGLFILVATAVLTSTCRTNRSKPQIPYPKPDLLVETLQVDLPDLSPGAKPLTFILVRPGTFTMGSPSDEPGRSENDWPAHQVTISKHFYLGTCELTQAQWKTLMSKNPSYFKDRPDHPVEKVTWRKCQLFIDKLNQLGLGTFRLPTEAEWEYACRAGTTARFYFGDAPSCTSDSQCEQADEFMWWAGNNYPDGPKEVGIKPANPWGLHDMHGNVHEWCADRWQDPYPREAQIDPLGPQWGSRFLLLWTNRVARGGCFEHGGLNHCRSAYRFYEQALDYYYGLGFRLVREADETCLKEKTDDKETI